MLGGKMAVVRMADVEITANLRKKDSREHACCAEG
jgi:hypothetical protein